MQLRVFHRLLKEHPEYTENNDQRVKLVLVGGSRNQGDARRVDGLRKLAEELAIEVCPINLLLLETEMSKLSSLL